MRRRRGIFTILFLVSCFIYFNWLLNVNDWSYESDNINNENIKKVYHKQKKLIYEVYESYENIRVEKNNKDRFILLTADQRFSKIANKEFENHETKLSIDELKNIFELFSKNEVFLLDIGILKDLKFTESIVEPKLFFGYKYGVKNFLKLNNYLKNSQDNLFINFGIQIQSFSNFNKVSKFITSFISFLFNEYLIKKGYN